MPTRGMRVLMVTPRFLPDIGGVERHVFEIGRRLAAGDVDVTVLTTDPTRSRPAREQRDGMVVRRVAAWPSGRDYHFAPGVYRAVSRERPDLVHVQSWHTPVAPLALLAAVRARLPLVVTPHGRGYSSRIRRPFRPLQRRALAPLLRRAGRVIALTDFERADLTGELGLSPDRVTVIPNGSDLANDLPTDTSSHPRSDGPTIVSLGRLERFKGHHRIVAALPYIRAVLPNAVLKILGTGPYEAELRRIADRHGVSEAVSIEFFSLEQRTELATTLRTADVGVLLSEFETQPIAAIEVAAFGSRLVVSDAPGLRELAATGLARAVPLDARPSELADVVVEELRRPRRAARPLLPSWESATAALLEVYEAVLASSDGG
jgi:glycosyltransferase involved in cell wall biosynthesis